MRSSRGAKGQSGNYTITNLFPLSMVVILSEMVMWLSQPYSIWRHYLIGNLRLASKQPGVSAHFSLTSCNGTLTQLHRSYG